MCVPNSNYVAYFAQWLILVWILCLQLILSESVGQIPLVVVGVAPVLASVVFLGLTLRLVWKETFTQLMHNDIATVDDNAVRQTDLIVQLPNGTRHATATHTFNLEYEPMHRPAPDALLARQGFQMYQPTRHIWAHKLTAEDVAIFFPSGRLTLSSGKQTAVRSGQFITMPFPECNSVNVTDEVVFDETYQPSVDAATGSPVVLQAECLRQWVRR